MEDCSDPVDVLERGAEGRAQVGTARELDEEGRNDRTPQSVGLEVSLDDRDAATSKSRFSSIAFGVAPPGGWKEAYASVDLCKRRLHEGYGASHDAPQQHPPR